MDTEKLPEEVREQVYVPSKEEAELPVELDLREPKGFQETEATVEVEID